MSKENRQNQKESHCSTPLEKLVEQKQLWCCSNRRQGTTQRKRKKDKQCKSSVSGKKGKNDKQKVKETKQTKCFPKECECDSKKRNTAKNKSCSKKSKEKSKSKCKREKKLNKKASNKSCSKRQTGKQKCKKGNNKKCTKTSSQSYLEQPILECSSKPIDESCPNKCDIPKSKSYPDKLENRNHQCQQVCKCAPKTSHDECKKKIVFYCPQCRKKVSPMVTRKYTLFTSIVSCICRCIDPRKQFVKYECVCPKCKTKVLKYTKYTIPDKPPEIPKKCVDDLCKRTVKYGVETVKKC